MLTQLRQALLLFVALTVVTGVGYPLLVTATAQVLFPHQANGSLVENEGRVIGSELIGQQFDDPKYFWPRPSATSPAYNGGASTGSNLGPTNPAQLDVVKQRVERLRNADADQRTAVPVDLATASGSGLDPHISPAAAEFQVERVAKARQMKADDIRQFVREHTEGRQLGILGEPRVNVLKLNLALDSAASAVTTK